MTFSPEECHEAGHYTRRLANWARALRAAADVESNLIPFCPHLRADLEVSAEADRKLARRHLRECRMIVLKMRRHPGFMTGWRAA